MRALRWTLYVFALVWGLLCGLTVRDAWGAQPEPPTADVVFAVLRKQPACWRDRNVPPELQYEQYAAIATAIAAASSTPEQAAYLLSIGWHESRWCLDVGSGARRGGDGEGYWQLEGRGHAAGARSGLSVDATKSAALLASAAVQRSYQCGSTPSQVLTSYAGRPCWQAEAWEHPPDDHPRSCHVGLDCVRVEGWPTLDSRVKTYRWALYALGRASRP